MEATEILTGSELAEYERGPSDEELDEIDEESDDGIGVMDQIADLFHESGMSIFDFSASAGAALHREGYLQGWRGCEAAAEADEEAVAA